MPIASSSSSSSASTETTDHGYDLGTERTDTIYISTISDKSPPVSISTYLGRQRSPILLLIRLERGTEDAS